MDEELTTDILMLEQLSLTQHLQPERRGRLGIGYGTATAHHGEIFQGVVEGAGGRLHRSLVSLPCHIFRSQAIFFPAQNCKVTVEPAWKVKSCRAAQLALARHNLDKWGGQLQVSSNIPLRWGLGSSTSDVTATILAVGDAFGRKFNEKEIASLAVKAEIASDSLMFGQRTVLFAHREGLVLEDLGDTIPELEILGFNTDLTGIGIDTMSFRPARYSWWEVEAFKPLLGLLRRAIRTQDPYLIGQVASASASINQKYLPKPRFDCLKAIVERVGAIGLQVAHSGTTVGLLFDPNDARTQGGVQRAQAMIAEMGFSQSCHFYTGHEGG